MNHFCAHSSPLRLATLQAFRSARLVIHTYTLYVLFCFKSNVQVVVYLALLQATPDTANKETLFVLTLVLLLVLGLAVALYRIYRFTRANRPQQFANFTSCLRKGRTMLSQCIQNARNQPHCNGCRSRSKSISGGEGGEAEPTPANVGVDEFELS